MQFTAAIVAFAAASVASASAVFKASDFSASCIPHSAQCVYEFGIIQAGNGETIPVKCRAQVVSDGSLPEITDGTCEESSRTFTVAKADGGLVLTVTQPVTPSSNQSGKHTIPASELEVEQTGASSQQKYIGAAAFDLE
ncbi:hypothetical protein INS49_013271 [Diaporthe citri]|uniref:uncharacterized protein n=1 Tax=Diaporthe citri TaxID=83186 RepID=UPI001C804287|nr:uncharacterized protein INS49_013271 [Diaporthe citri]KAG6357394.1 hypothetical protein INS49_013271 [Diaporthe citri]